MRRFAFTLLSLLSLVCVAQEKPAIKAVNQVVELSPGAVHTITLGWGVFTTIKFEGDKPIERVLLGSPIASVKVDEELNRLDIKPDFPEGATNMVVTLDGTDYVFILKVSKDTKDVIYTRTFTLASAKADALMADLTRMGTARLMKPSELNTVSYAKIIEKARIDAHYRASVSDLRTTQIGKVGQWNGCLIHFLEVNAFLDSDLLVFKVQFVNTTGYGLFCKSRQIQLKVAGKNVPIDASLQDSTDGWIMPGQMETYWLFVQGERIAGFGNEWTLMMPPEANQVKQVLGSK